MRFSVFGSSLQIVVALMGLCATLSCTAQYPLNPKLESALRPNPLQSKLTSQDKSDELHHIDRPPSTSMTRPLK